MNVKKFTATSTRDALRMVRETLGPDAVILSNRNADGMVEILALAADDMASIAPSTAERQSGSTNEVSRKPAARPTSASHNTPQQPPIQQPVQQSDRNTSGGSDEAGAGRGAGRGVQRSPERTPLSEPVLAALTGKYTPQSRQKSSGEANYIGQNSDFYDKNQAAGLANALETARIAAPSNHANSTTAATAANQAALEIAGVMKEIRSMRGMLESQLSELSWSSQHQREPHRSAILREMLAAGFSPSLARYLVEKMPAGHNLDTGLRWAREILANNLAIMHNEDEILGNGGVFALVGPTGVGKTTTTAKLAARCVMRHGPGKLALITTDGYRVGGYEQLRIYGKILGVMVHSVKDEADLRIALDELKGKHTVLIDTIGVSQRDKMVAEQVAMLASSGSRVKRLLCLSATSTGETLSEVVRSYRGAGLAGCIVTKLDEAATVGSVLDVIIRQKLSLYYVANGQRVPEDLHTARAPYLIDRAFKLKRETVPFQYQDEELPLVISTNRPATRQASEATHG